MKKITLLTLLFFVVISWSQNKDSRNNQFDLLKDKTQTKILYNRVAPIAKLTSKKEDACNTLYYKQAFYEIQRSDFLNRLPSLTTLEKATEEGFASRIIPISILVSEFEALKPSVKAQNQLILNNNNQYEPVSNAIDLFDTYKVGLASPLIKQLKGTSIQFQLKSDLIFNTTNKTISKIEVNFNNLGFKTINENEIITINFETTGIKEGVFKITLNNGEVFTNTVSFKLIAQAQPLDYSKNISQGLTSEITPVTTITSSLTYQGYDESAAHAGQGEFQIYYDNEAGLLDKIVIVCDGFDPGDGRDTSAIYNLLNYGSPTQNLGNTVRDLGYDVVVLNFPQYTRPDGVTNIDGGVDYIQRNARVLIELINYLNANKVGNQELVVIGPSMGGLISRYALRYMEMNGMNHHTRLWLSFDSPHLGANVPIGMQHMFNYIAYDSDIADLTVRAIVDAMLKSPAARQMLIDHFEGHLVSGSTTEFNQNSTALLPTGHPTYRNVFQTELNTMGFPQKCRKIAISNGASNGAMTGTPGMTVLNGLDVPDSEGFSRALLDLKFTPNANGNIQVSRVRKQIWTLFWVTIGTGATNARSFSYTAGLDSAPGGQFDMEGLAADAGSNPTLTNFLNALQIKKFDFIPAKSSLAISSGNNWYANIVNTDVTNFDAYYAPTQNEFHVTLTPNNVAFAIDEIVNNIQLKCPNITTWDGSNWSNGAPNKETQVVFNDDYTSNSNLEACSVTVNGNAVVTFLSGDNLIVRGKIDVAATAQLKINDNANIYQIEEIANTGNILLDKTVTIKRLNYVFWSSPVANQNLKNFSPETLNQRFYEFNPAGGTTETAYINIDPLTHNFLPAKGYTIRAENNWTTTPTDWTGSFNGTPFNGRINQTVENYGATLGYNLVGNPYPSPINIEEFIEGNQATSNGTLHFWTNTNDPVGGIYIQNNWATRNLTGGTAAYGGSIIPDLYIESGQGFLIDTPVNGTLYFTNSMRNATSNNQFMAKTISATTENNKFWLNFSADETPQNQILIGYVENATNGFDNGYDGKLYNNSNASLYSVVEDNKLVIQGKAAPFNTDDIVPLGYKTNVDGTFTISLDATEGIFVNNQNIYLKDNFTGSIINLSENSYSFYSNAIEENARFEIIYNAALNNTFFNTNANTMFAFVNNNNLVFNSTIAKLQKVEVYDMQGRLLWRKLGIDANRIETQTILKTNSVLLIQMTDEDNNTIKSKVIF
ncbi:hypothetical protein [Flavobacterium sp.]|uniref:alpha/beta hydrolase n=1 Tax=Flavobacterium sp. TaxID=239 RepID=UPI0035293286